MQNQKPAPVPGGLIYHLYPLGTLGAPHERSPHDGSVAGARTLRDAVEWVSYIRELGAAAVLLGPVFVSETHGYDVVDPYHVDPRIGNDDDLRALVDAFHEAGISVILDAVMNHVGRSFFAFRDVLAEGQASPYASWFAGLDFSRNGPRGEPFAYETWDGHDSLVKLDVDEPGVSGYLLGAVDRWITVFGIDGLRLDAADVISPSFWPKLRRLVDELYHPPVPYRFGNGRFWMVGEIVHGDYRTITGPEALDGATNFECYKGLYSSFNDGNFFEIAWSLNRLFGDAGIYAGLSLLNFVDNHDVPRIASTLADPSDLYPLHLLLFTIPGFPAIYYGSEVGIPGTKGTDDWPLRPALRPARITGQGEAVRDQVPHPDLLNAIVRLNGIRDRSAALREGSYRQVFVDHRLLAFRRDADTETILVVVNSDDGPQRFTPESRISGVDLLNDAETVLPDSGAPDGAIVIPPKWGRIIRIDDA
ncbi:MAG: alpha-amylase family glycosyl hydrolase [Alkalispirochaeta sp.]